MKRRHQLDFYGYRESNRFVPRYCKCVAPGVTLTLSKEEGNIITIAKDGGIKARLSLATDGINLYLVNMETGQRIGGVGAPGAHSVTDFSMNGTDDILTVCVKRVDGTLENKVINLGNVIRAYTAGDGIDISDKAISVRLAENGGLEFRDGAIGVNDNEVALQPELDAVIGNLNGLSGQVSDFGEDVQDIYDDLGEIHNVIDNLDFSLSGGSGITISDGYVNFRIGDGLSYDENGNVYVSKQFDNDVDTELDENSTNPVENKAIVERLTEIERVSSEALNYLNNRVNQNSSDILAISANTPSVDYPTAGDGLDYDEVLNEYFVNVGEGLAIDDNGRLSATFSIAIDDQLDINSNNPVANSAITKTLKDNEEVVSAALNNLKDRIETASGDIMTAVETSISSMSGEIDSMESTLGNYATKGEVDALSDRIDALPDFSALQTEIAGKADQSDLDSVAAVANAAVPYSAFNESQDAQNVIIENKADASVVAELTDKLGAIVDLNHIKQSGDVYTYEEPSVVDYHRPLDHCITLLHSMMNPGDGEAIGEEAFVNILWKLVKILQGIGNEDLGKINQFLKNIPSD